MSAPSLSHGTPIHLPHHFTKNATVVNTQAFATRATPPHDYAGVRLGLPVHAESFRHPSTVVRACTIAVDGGGKSAAGSLTLGVEGARGALSAARNHRRSSPSYQNFCSTLGAIAASSATGDERRVLQGAAYATALALHSSATSSVQRVCPYHQI